MSTETRSIRRPVLILAAAVLAGSSALVAWRLTSLDGLPDVGEPFDVEAFCRPIPDDANAFTLYKQAFEKLVEEPPNLQFHWDTAGEVERKWLAENREAMEIWKRGTERPDALYIPPRELTFATKLPVTQGLRSFARLVQLEGTRLESEGKFDEALDWYLATLRASRHLGTRGTAIGRLVGVALHRMACDSITRLASVPEVRKETLRLALDSAIAIDSMTPPNSDTNKSEYFVFLSLGSDPDAGDPAEVESRTRETWWTPIGRSLFRTKRILLKEPERSRRIIRLVLANRLAYCDLPATSRPPTAMPTPPPGPNNPPNSALLNLYLSGPRDADSPRILSPAEIDRWAQSSLYARDYMTPFWAIDNAIARERGAQANLLISLANALHARDHDKPPESVRDLVGPYLKAIPEGYVVPE